MMSASMVTPRWFAWVGQVGGGVVVGAAVLRREGGVAQVAPEHRRHAQLVRGRKRRRHLLDLAPRLGRAEVDRGADGDAALLAGLADRREHDLVVGVRVGQDLVVVQLEQERDPVGVAAGGRAERPERRRDRVAAALDRELDDPAPGRSSRGSWRTTRRPSARCPGRPGRIDTYPVPAEAAVRVERLQRPQHRRRPVGERDHAIDEVRPREVQPVGRDGVAGVPQQRLGVVAQDRLDLGDVRCGCDGHRRLLSARPCRRDVVCVSRSLGVACHALCVSGLRAAPRGRRIACASPRGRWLA